MNELQTRPFMWSDLDLLGDPVVPRMATLLQEARSHPDMALAVEGVARTAYTSSGDFVSAWGILPMWEGVGSLWVWFTPLTCKWLKSVLRIGEQELLLAHEVLGYERIQVEIESSLEKTLKLAIAAGFEYEGLMRNYGRHGEGDYHLLARTF